MTIKAYAAQEAGGILEPFEYDPGELEAEQVELDISSCGICHSDLSMLNNDWQMTEYPLVPGHEIVGKIGAVGERYSSRAWSNSWPRMVFPIMYDLQCVYVRQSQSLSPC